MKSKIILLCTSLIFAFSCSQNTQNRITISGAWALYPMVVKWAEEYKKLHPDVSIDISAGGAGKGMTDALSHTVDLGMISRDITDVEIQKGAWWISVVKDAVVPTFNMKNPHYLIILARGISREQCKNLWLKKTETWESLMGIKGQQRNEIHIYTRSDACGAAQTWAKYLDADQEDLTGTGIFGDPGMAEAVKNDKWGIGYNNINFAYDAKSKQPINGISILPLDFNNNKKIDTGENIYATRDELVKAIAMDKYPSPPARNLHLVSGGKPAKQQIKDFLMWILSDGQAYVDESGYIGLRPEFLKKQAEKLN